MGGRAGAGRGPSFKIHILNEYRKISYLYCKLCRFKSGVYIFSNHRLKTVWRSEMSFLAQRGEQLWDVLTVPNGVISFLLIPLWFTFLVLFCRENSG